MTAEELFSSIVGKNDSINFNDREYFEIKEGVWIVYQKDYGSKTVGIHFGVERPKGLLTSMSIRVDFPEKGPISYTIHQSRKLDEIFEHIWRFVHILGLELSKKDFKESTPK